ncbi:beta-lactamase family protein [Pendulispora brunnea]|uniref:Beta-lactamase family protein n=1 Tax=Pendulispora brunnea TaxID=2905690 RepID=A0ABZ2KGX3_9BACT
MKKAILLAALALVACSDASGSGDAQNDKGPGGGQNGPGPGSRAPTDSKPPSPLDPPPAGGGSVACDQETAAIQTAMDAAHPTNTDAVATIKTPACGVRFFTSGPAKVDATKLHRVASVTKTYTAGVVLKLVEEGKLSLDASASQWLPSIPGGAAVHVRHLLQHVSGLKPFDNTLGFQACLTFGCTPDRLLSLSFDQGQASQPGTTFAYANVNFVALGVIAEKVAGKPLATLLHEQVLTPIHAEKTFFAGGETVGGTLAIGRDEGGRDATNRLNMTGLYAAGNIAASPGDVLTWIEALGSGTFYGPDLQGEITKFIPFAGTTDYKYGLAMMELQPSASFGGGPGRGHNGDLIPGYHTQAFYFPERQTTVVSIIDYNPPGLAQNPQPIYAVFRAILKTLFSASP